MNPFRKLKLSYSLAILGLLLVFSLPLFMQLDYLSIDSWDEALFAIRAYYIAENGVPIKDFSQLPGLTEVHNSKPALVSYIQAGFMKLIGYNELALRLPTSLSFLALCFSIIYYLKKIHHSYSVGILASIILVSTRAMLNPHMGRSANQDIPFTLFCFLFVVQAYLYMEDQKLKNLVLSLLFFVMAFFTKSVSIFLCFPALIIFALHSKKLKQMFQDKAFWTSAAILALIVLGAYLNGARHLNNVKRITHVIMHEGNIFFYLERIFFEASFPLVFVIFFIYSITQVKKYAFLQLAVLQVLVILSILSLAQTKLIWYAAPIYPFLAIGSAYGIYEGLKSLQARYELPKFSPKLAVLLLVILIPPYVSAIKGVYLLNEPSASNEVCQVLKRAKDSYPHIKNIKLIFLDEGEFNPNIEYYSLLYEEKYGYQIEYHSDLSKVHPGDYLILYNDILITELMEHYEAEKKIQFQSSYLYLVGASLF
ncbi:MAG: glycosyltransferase family 39 protein [Crocinitomicaceae bacterium]